VLQPAPDLDSRPVKEAGEDLTIHLTGRNFRLLDASAYMPKRNRAYFQEQALLVPKRLIPDFHAGQLAGWHVELHFAHHNAQSLRLVLIGDVVVGRIDADVNLDYFSAASQGVSRHHILLRSGDTQLYLIDMQSRNGTLHNGTLASSTRAYTLATRDVITLGNLSFTLHIAGIGKSAKADLS
jgi:hypothetical protein